MHRWRSMIVHNDRDFCSALWVICSFSICSFVSPVCSRPFNRLWVFRSWISHSNKFHVIIGSLHLGIVPHYWEIQQFTALTIALVVVEVVVVVAYVCSTFLNYWRWLQQRYTWHQQSGDLLTWPWPSASLLTSSNNTNSSCLLLLLAPPPFEMLLDLFILSVSLVQ